MKRIWFAIMLFVAVCTGISSPGRQRIRDCEPNAVAGTPRPTFTTAHYLNHAGFSPHIEPRLAPLTKIQRTVESPGSMDDTLFVGIPRTPEGDKVYIRFLIEYWDIFQKPIDTPHRTMFCGYYPTTQPPFFFNCTKVVGEMN
jgi:hypothetical protein